MPLYTRRVWISAGIALTFVAGCSHPEEPVRTAPQNQAAPVTQAEQQRIDARQGLRNAARLRGQMQQRAEQKHQSP
jgi:hypothetical protein